MHKTFSNVGAKLLVVTLALGLAPDSFAIFDDTAARQQIVELQKEVETLKGSMEQLGERLTAIKAENQQLAELLRSLQGQIEDVGHKISQERSKIQEATKDSSAELRKELEQLRSALNKIRLKDLPPEPKLYEQSFQQYEKGDYVGAISGFNDILLAYPDGQFSVNAQYWVGMSHLALKRYDEAIISLEILINKHPSSDRAPDAMLNLAQSFVGKGDKSAAKSVLADLIEKHPTSLAADRARQQSRSL